MDSFKFLFKVALIFIIPIFVALLTFIFMQRAFLVPIDKNSTEKVYVKITSQKDLSTLGQEMVDKKLIKYAWVLGLISKVIVKDKNSRIKMGEYELSPSMTPRQMLEKMIQGDVFLRKVVVKEGSSVWDIGTALEEAGIISAEKFKEAVGSQDMLSRYGLASVGSFEGYFSPQEYEFSSTESPYVIISTMIAAAEDKWPKEYTEAAEELELSRHEVLTLASILQKEAKPIDYQDLAVALYNRSSYAMKLESDETVIYGLTDYDGNFLPEYRDIDHPYNTWVNLGFPPGPICNPSEEAVKAVITMPQKTHLFWVKNSDGYFEFAANRAELDMLIRSKEAQMEEQKKIKEKSTKKQ